MLFEEAAPKLDTEPPKGPRALPPAKKPKPGGKKGKAKPAGKKPSGKKKPSGGKKPAAVKAPKAWAGKEVDPSKLDDGKAKKRLASIYRLEKTVEQKQAAFDSASAVRRAAKAELEDAQDKLELEIREQRFGPGPLFNATGTGPASPSSLNPEP
jgi:hypothetical protein